MTEQKPKLIACDEQTKRVIFGIGKQRMAFDFTTRITHLPPGFGDQPAAILPLKPRPAEPGYGRGTPEEARLRKSPARRTPAKSQKVSRP
jgi:hypothetical protein